MSADPVFEPLAPEPFVQRAYRFARALIVGGGATAGDAAVFIVCVRVLHIAAGRARFPALLTGACIQFFGNRTFTFRANRGRLARQAWRFLLAEGAALATNLGVFWFLEPRLRSVLPAEIISFMGTFVVFVGFSYPMRRLVIFRLRRDETPGPDAPGGDAPRRAV